MGKQKGKMNEPELYRGREVTKRKLNKKMWQNDMYKIMPPINIFKTYKVMSYTLIYFFACLHSFKSCLPPRHFTFPSVQMYLYLPSSGDLMKSPTEMSPCPGQEVNRKAHLPRMKEILLSGS